MKKLGCASCGGTMKKMSKGGMATKAMGPGKKPFAAGIPYFTGAGQTGPESMKKGGTKKEHPITTFRKANEARNAMVKKSITKYQSRGEVKSTGVGMFETTPTSRPGETPRSAMARINATSPKGPNPKGIKSKVDSSRVRAGVSAKTPAAPKSTEPVRKPSIEFGDPMVGITIPKQRPKTKYEDAVINTKSPSTKTSGYTPKRGATTSVKKTVGPRPSVDEMREANIKKYSALKSKIAGDAKPKPRSAAAEFKAGVMASPIGYAAKKVYDMTKKKGGVVKSKKK
jgi:hypothetical protein